MKKILPATSKSLLFLISFFISFLIFLIFLPMPAAFANVEKRCYTYPDGYSDNGNWISGTSSCNWPSGRDVVNDLHDMEIRATDPSCIVKKRFYTWDQGYSDNGNWIAGTDRCRWPSGGGWVTEGGDWDVVNDLHDMEISIECTPTPPPEEEPDCTNPVIGPLTYSPMEGPSFRVVFRGSGPF
ncbi:MAG: hypothetical protein U1D67_06725, partial [Dehalococcoidia bacterium]|nr:hypothetical protein [Dehalococcoidia bacterium]